MRRLYGWVPLVVLLTSGAQANSFDDFNRGIEALNRGDSAAAIDAFDHALAVGDLDPSRQSVARFDRGKAYLDRKLYTDADGGGRTRFWFPFPRVAAPRAPGTTVSP